MRSTLKMLVLVALPIFGTSLLAVEPDARAKQRIAALEKLLPEYLQAADECEKALLPFADAKSEQVIAAVDGARLRIAAVRSVREIIARDPNFLIFHIGEPALPRWKEGWEHFLACAKSDTDPFRGATSGVRSCRSRIDGQLLFYVYRLPRNYDPKKRYPMEVALHSGAGLIWRADWIDGKPGNDPAKAEATERIWISPCGRGNNSYAGMGEVAVMDAIRDAQKYFAVDANRVTIGGASMGGTGGFRLGTLHPDVFAAIHSLTGGPHYGVPKGNGRFDAMLLVDNLCNTSMCIWDAPKEGHYATNHQFADWLRERAKQHPGTYPHLELTDPNGGHGVIDRKLIAEGRDWLRGQQRNPYPKRVVYKTWCLRYDGAYWAKLDTMEDANAPARIEAELLDGGKLRVVVENADRFSLDLVKELVGDARELAVTVNGGAAVQAPTGQRVHFARSGDRWGVSPERYPAGLVKKHGLSGPVQDVFMEQPVLMVYGTAAKQTVPEQQGMIDAAVMHLFGPGDGGSTLHTPFERKADHAVSAADLAERNLVLFGTPRQNLLLRKLADRLPVKFLEDGVEFDAKTYRGADVGLVVVYPNPLNPERYVLLLPEQYVGGPPLALPDFLVVKQVKNGAKVGQQVLTQGTFDARWRPRP
jgi:pimeloyl-ACP methyl ester carboxylesterase